MHLYMITRGKRNFVRRFIENLEAVFLPITRNGMPMELQLVPRPVELWEVAFPEPCKDQVLSMIGNMPLDVHDEPGLHTGESSAFIPWLVAKFVKKLGLMPIPKDIPKTAPQVPRENVGVHLVGLKEDKKVPLENEQI